MSEIKFLVSDETLEAIRQMGDHKLRGRIWAESHNGQKCLRFEPYRKRAAKYAGIVICIVLPETNTSVEPLNPEADVKI